MDPTQIAQECSTWWTALLTWAEPLKDLLVVVVLFKVRGDLLRNGHGKPVPFGRRATDAPS